MAKEAMIARENGVMGLRSRNAIGGRADRAHGRATYPSMNKSDKYSDLRKNLQTRSYDDLVDAIKVMSSAPVKNEGLNDLLRVYAEEAEKKKR